MMSMKFIRSGLLLFLMLVSPCVGAEEIVRVGTFNKDALNVIAEARGFLKKENLKTEINLVNNSIDLMRNLKTGKYDLIHTNADNVIAWTEGQGEDPKPHDFVIFMGGNQGVGQILVAAEGIQSIGDLKGKVLAVDDPRTGYSSVLVYMLKKHGLSLNKDFTLKAFGNTKSRADAVTRGEAAGALMNLPQEEIKKRKFNVMGRSEDYVPVYARGVGATRRDWANKNEALLVRYIKAMIATTDWILDPKNREEALQLLLPANENSKLGAERMYADAVNAKLGYIPGSRIDKAGITTVIELREAMGFLKPPLPSPLKYVDERFYQKAVALPGDVIH